MNAADCERIADGILSQPVNAVSSLSFVLVGLLLLIVIRPRPASERGLLRAVALMSIMVGIGSAAFHGPSGRLAIWLHDASLTGLLLLLVAIEITRRTTRAPAPAFWVGVIVASGAMVAVWPDLSSPVAGTTLAAVVILAAAPARWSRPGSVAATQSDGLTALLIPLVLLAIGAVVFLASRTGGALCDPDSLFQGHALWHLLAATGLGLYAASRATVAQ